MLLAYYATPSSSAIPLVGAGIAFGGPWLFIQKDRTHCADCSMMTPNAPYCAGCGAEKTMDETYKYERILARVRGGDDA